MENKTRKRLLSLDVLRGITIAGMILVNNAGDWNYVYTPLRHASWNGLTPTDLVFPFFMFMMGISTYISLRKTQFKPSTSLVVKILKRTALIFLIGLGLGWLSLAFRNFYSLSVDEFGFFASVGKSIIDIENLRILGVLQRLALSYGAAAIIAITVKHKYFPALIASLLVGYFILLLVGNGFEQGDSNILGIVDRSILGINHIYNSGFLDPEGILPTIPSIAHVLIGFCFGRLVMEIQDNRERMLQLFIYGAILTFAGFLLSYACPINKTIWSPTFVLVTCGLGATLFGLLIWIIDVNENRKWSVFFESFGVNPLFIYVFSQVLATLLANIYLTFDGVTKGLSGWAYYGLTSVGIDNYLASCIYAILFVLVCWAIGHILYKKKIYISI